MTYTVLVLIGYIRSLLTFVAALVCVVMFTKASTQLGLMSFNPLAQAFGDWIDAACRWSTLSMMLIASIIVDLLLGHGERLLFHQLSNSDWRKYAIKHPSKWFQFLFE